MVVSTDHVVRVHNDMADGVINWRGSAETRFRAVGVLGSVVLSNPNG